jgi:hypothetical protein
MSSTSMWSAAVFDPALPCRTIPASASPEAISGRSKKHTIGWKPNVRFQVGAASSLSECAITIVASMSKHSSWARSGPAPAAHARSLALARPARNRGRCAPVTRSSTRHAVGVEATGPNRPG